MILSGGSVLCLHVAMTTIISGCEASGHLSRHRPGSCVSVLPRAEAGRRCVEHVAEQTLRARRLGTGPASAIWMGWSMEAMTTGERVLCGTLLFFLQIKQEKQQPAVFCGFQRKMWGGEKNASGSPAGPSTFCVETFGPRRVLSVPDPSQQNGPLLYSAFSWQPHS